MVRGRKGKRHEGKTEVSPSAIVYRGPIGRKVDNSETDTHTQSMHYATFVYADSSSYFKNVYGSSPAQAQDWADMANIYKEYRTLGWKLSYHPSNRYSKVTTLTNPVASVIDRNSSTALTTYQQAAGYASCKIRSLEDPFTITVKMSGVAEAAYVSTASPVSVSIIKFYGELLTASALYGLVLIEYEVQFRGRA